MGRQFPSNAAKSTLQRSDWLKKRLQQKKIVIVAPEGTRSKHGRLNQGYPGIALLAIRSGAPILPVVFYGNEKIKDLRIGKRTDMVIKVGKPYQDSTEWTRP